jgi:hypothetical protein
VNNDGNYSISADESIVNIDANTIFVAVAIDAILLSSARIYRLLLQAILVLIPAIRQPAGFYFFVFLTSIALLENTYKSRIDDLTATGLETLGALISLKHLE